MIEVGNRSLEICNRYDLPISIEEFVERISRDQDRAFPCRAS